mmetsp:Transcript_36102/g.116761  ORF Transcript_36102/g.116761 Transcript_36102/m.116761 type:complete len:275 (+) Transcript_36102:528-1352(+)
MAILNAVNAKVREALANRSPPSLQEAMPQQRSCRGSVRGIPAQTVLEEGPARRRQGAGHRRQGIRRGDVHQGEHHVVKGVRAPRPLRRRHLQHGAAQAPDVSLAPVSILVQDDFGSHPRNRAHGREGGGGAVLLGAAEVGELHAEVRRGEEEVRALDVAVDHRRAAAVQVVEPCDSTERGLLQQLRVQGAVLLEDAGDGSTCHVLHEDEQSAVYNLLAQVADDVRVLQAPADVQLDLEFFYSFLARIARLARHSLFNRKDAAILHVLGPADGAE